MADSAQMRFLAACMRFGIPCRREDDGFLIMDEDVERTVVVCPEDQAADLAYDVVIEDEAQLDDFEGGNLEAVLREEILDPVLDDLSGLNW
jgi:hypothetical protein